MATTYVSISNLQKYDELLKQYIANGWYNKTEIDGFIQTIEGREANFIDKSVNDLVNYYAKSQVYTKAEIANLISTIPTFGIAVVDSLPTQDISTSTLYLLRDSEEPGNLFTEYIYVNNAWEVLGTQNINLSNYYTKDEVDDLIPTLMSELYNDAGYITSDSLSDDLVTGIKGENDSVYQKGNVIIDKRMVGLSQVENKSSATIRGELTSTNVISALGYIPVSSEEKAQINGLATLDENGKLAPSQIPEIPVSNSLGNLNDVELNGVLDSQILIYDEDLEKFVNQGYDVSVGIASANKVWKTDESGVPGWRDETNSGVTGIKGSAESSYRTGNVNLTADNIGAIPTTSKGAANGVAELGSNGLIVSSQLPSYVDDVVEYSTTSDFPSTGETGKIYVATSTNLTYRWTGSTYVEISPSLALGETSSTAYRGDRGKIAYDDSQTNKTSIGTLSNLTTSVKSSLVDAINEINGSSGFAGGTITSDLTLQRNDIDAKQSDNGVTSVTYPTTFNVLDKNGLILTRKEAVVRPNGNIEAYWYVRNYNGSTTQVAQKGIRLAMDKSGNITYTVDEPDKFKTALNIGNIENKSSETIRSEITTSDITSALGYTPANSTDWQLNTLNNNGYVPAGSGYPNKVWKTDSNGNPSWRDESSSGGSSSFDGLTDVSLSNLVNGDVAVYNSTTQKWENSTTLKDLSNTVGEVNDAFNELFNEGGSSVTITTFADGTDEEIAAMLEAYYNDELSWEDMGWAVGNTRTIHLNSYTAPNPYSSYTRAEQDITIVIIAHDHTDLAAPINGHTKACITVQTREIITDSNIYTDGVSGYDTTFTKWSDLYIRSYLNSTILGAIPSGDFKSAIKQSNHNRLTTNGNNPMTANTRDGSKTDTTTESVTDTLFLPSYPEIFGNVQCTTYLGGATPNSEEGAQFNYYATAANRIKYLNNNGSTGSSMARWWLGSACSAYSSSEYYWLGIDTTGEIYSISNGNLYLAPAWAM